MLASCAYESRQESDAAEQGRAGAQQLLAGVREELLATRQMLEGEQAQCTRYLSNSHAVSKAALKVLQSPHVHAGYV